MYSSNRYLKTAHDCSQSVINAAARLIYSSKCRNKTAPQYLADDLQWSADDSLRMWLRSALSNKLVMRRSQLSTAGDRTFGVAAPRLWNSLPACVTSANTLPTFKNHFKTHLFNLSYFNSLHHSDMLQSVADRAPHLLSYCHLASVSSVLWSVRHHVTRGPSTGRSIGSFAFLQHHPTIARILEFSS